MQSACKITLCKRAWRWHRPLSDSTSFESSGVFLSFFFTRLCSFASRSGSHIDKGMLLGSWQPRVRACTNCAQTASGQCRKTPLCSHTGRFIHTSARMKGTLTNTCLLQDQIFCILLRLVTHSALVQTHRSHASTFCFISARVSCMPTLMNENDCFWLIVEN